jgi:hypothetical protein
MAHDPEQRVLASKAVILIALGYMAILVGKCPCRPELFKCHLTQLFLSMAFIVAVIMSYNGLRVMNY